MAYKFDDCAMCRFKRKPHICRDCDYGEQFEDAEVQELRFDNDGFVRTNHPLVSEDDEPEFNPDDLFERFDAEQEEQEEENEDD